MKFSLILVTYATREQLVTALLDSLATQTYENFEVIIVDQNPDDRLNHALNKYNYPIKHIKSEPVGLSSCRNIGIKQITGEVVAFPDDDCTYPANLLEKVEGILETNINIDGLSGRTVDHQGNNTIGHFPSSKEYINLKNIWASHNSTCLFLRDYVVEKVGKFDETLGTPLFFGSSEETDYVVRTLKRGFTLLFDPSIKVFHPDLDFSNVEKLKKRGRSYGRGVARLVLKHPDFFRWKDYLKVFFGPLIKTCLNISNRNQRIFNWQMWIGRIEGLMHHNT
ncbi:MAG: glycosyltransferase family 2 protein [Candidatus Ranarchaeia archaeon]